MTPTVTIITKASRAATTLPATLAQARAAGLDPMIIASPGPDPTPGAEVRRLGLVAADLTADNPAGLLFLEDDLTIDGPLLWHQLALAVAAGRITTMCATRTQHYPPGVLDEPEPIKARLEPMPHYGADYGAAGGFHGSHALYLPAPVIQLMRTNRHWFAGPNGRPLTPDQGNTPSDHARGQIVGLDLWVKDHAHAFGGILLAIPNPVDHVGDGPNEPFRSQLFAREWSPA